MKKVCLMFLTVMLSIGITKAQYNCMDFFPEEGTMMISKTYTGNNTLLATKIYKVSKAQSYHPESEVELQYVLQNSMGSTVDRGELKAYCDGSNFYMDVANRVTSPEAVNLLLSNTEIIRNFSDYPNFFTTSTEPYSDDFLMTTGQYTVKSANDENKYITVREYGRNYTENDDIETPAGNFNAAKITYVIEVFDNETNETRRYNGTEWYVGGMGVVRSELRDDNGNLERYTVLTNVTKD